MRVMGRSAVALVVLLFCSAVLVLLPHAALAAKGPYPVADDGCFQNPERLLSFSAPEQEGGGNIITDFLDMIVSGFLQIFGGAAESYGEPDCYAVDVDGNGQVNQDDVNLVIEAANRYDIDGDGDVDGDDKAQMNRRLNSMTVQYPDENFDMNFDGSVDGDDKVQMNRRLNSMTDTRCNAGNGWCSRRDVNQDGAANDTDVQKASSMIPYCSPAPPAPECDILVAQCQDLDQEGRTYCLENDIYAGSRCLSVKKNNTVIDCMGHGIRNNVSDTAIEAWGKVTNLTIRNCVIETGRFDAIYINKSSNIQVIDSNISGLQSSLSISYSYNISIRNVSASRSTFGGIYVSNSENITISGCSLKGNNGTGLYISGSSGADVSDVAAYDNNEGVVLLFSRYSVLTNVTAANNRYDGIVISGSSYNKVLDSKAYGNMDSGLEINGPLSSAHSDYNQIINLTSEGNAKGVSILWESWYNMISGSRICGNINKDVFCFYSPWANNRNSLEATSCYTISSECRRLDGSKMMCSLC